MEVIPRQQEEYAQAYLILKHWKWGKSQKVYLPNIGYTIFIHIPVINGIQINMNW